MKQLDFNFDAIFLDAQIRINYLPNSIKETVNLKKNGALEMVLNLHIISSDRQCYNSEILLRMCVNSLVKKCVY